MRKVLPTGKWNILDGDYDADHFEKDPVKNIKREKKENSFVAKVFYIVVSISAVFLFLFAYNLVKS
ncbi:MAG: hypothetical protein GX452_04960 [Ignavibacteriales bacterium]|jgi:hypothetical protein|nr:hypothetical protein [Ignavibacteriaceae bacterium]NLH60734.1 hypothetical protein [Ignavibacteriales bacterium]HOJ17143.1 hypothetical protein [Ignavibacteriaceae bacterium]HPO56039.1 hypothetical protein [Ignavibacteriaceae bacterium]